MTQPDNTSAQKNDEIQSIIILESKRSVELSNIQHEERTVTLSNAITKQGLNHEQNLKNDSCQNTDYLNAELFRAQLENEVLVQSKHAQTRQILSKRDTAAQHDVAAAMVQSRAILQESLALRAHVQSDAQVSSVIAGGNSLILQGHFRSSENALALENRNDAYNNDHGNPKTCGPTTSRPQLVACWIDSFHLRATDLSRFLRSVFPSLSERMLGIEKFRINGNTVSETCACITMLRCRLSALQQMGDEYIYHAPRPLSLVYIYLALPPRRRDS